MRNTFAVTVNMGSADELATFINAVGHLVQSITVVTSRPDVSPAMPKAQGRRGSGSKVNQTILDAMKEGPRQVKELKEALERSGMSPGSLSTGLATLQKSGAVTRVSEGVYGLAA